MQHAKNMICMQPNFQALENARNPGFLDLCEVLKLFKIIKKCKQKKRFKK